MPRKALKPREKRGMPKGDSVYNSVLVARFINKLDHRGKKSLAEKIIYKAFEIMKEKTGEEPLEVFNRAIENARPLLEVIPSRVGRATSQVPMEEVKQADLCVKNLHKNSWMQAKKKVLL